jgi:hypothetical protein
VTQEFGSRLMMKTAEIHQRSNMLSPSPPSQVKAAEDDTASQLSRIWQEQLGVEIVSHGQNFFDLGGDSSLAVRVFSEIEKVFGIYCEALSWGDYGHPSRGTVSDLQ